MIEIKPVSSSKVFVCGFWIVSAIVSHKYAFAANTQTFTMHTDMGNSVVGTRQPHHTHLVVVWNTL